MGFSSGQMSVTGDGRRREPSLNIGERVGITACIINGSGGSLSRGYWVRSTAQGTWGYPKKPTSGWQRYNYCPAEVLGEGGNLVSA